MKTLNEPLRLKTLDWTAAGSVSRAIIDRELAPLVVQNAPGA